MVKNYVLDTNILMTTEGKAVYGFDDNTVVIPAIVLEELDNLKTAFGEKGFQAREAIRVIDSITNSSRKTKCWDIPGLPGKLKIMDILDFGETERNLPEGYDIFKPDNIIIETALLLKKQELEEGNPEVILVTNDISMRIKALTVDIAVQSYRNDQISEDFVYTGRVHLETTESLERLFKDGYIEAPNFPSLEYEENRPLKEQKYHEHEFIHLTNGTNSALCKYEKGKLVLLPDYNSISTFGIFPKNQGQRFALDALLAPADEIPLVILKGPAGTGKTLLSLAAALSQTYTSFGKRRKRNNEDGYDKIICARANVLADADIGFLPGDIQEKTLPLLAPIIDNLTYLLGSEEEDMDQVVEHVDSILDNGIIEVTSLAYIRGRSLPRTYIIIDEAQNLSRLQIKTIATRIGTGSKLVIMGDINQIDNPKLDKRSCGLS